MTGQGIPADPEIDRVLAEQLGNLGAKSLFGAGRYGARWSARRLKTETAHQVFSVSPDEQARIVASLAEGDSGAGKFGKIESQDDSIVTARGIVGSGFGSLNPAYVIIIADAQSATLGIAAHAKEGLIKQRTAQKALATVSSAFGLQ